MQSRFSSSPVHLLDNALMKHSDSINIEGNNLFSMNKMAKSPDETVKLLKAKTNNSIH